MMNILKNIVNYKNYNFFLENISTNCIIPILLHLIHFGKCNNS